MLRQLATLSQAEPLATLSQAQPLATRSQAQPLHFCTKTYGLS
jgi:hypothetical protein